MKKTRKTYLFIFATFLIGILIFFASTYAIFYERSREPEQFEIDDKLREVIYSEDLSYYQSKSENIIFDEEIGTGFVNNELLIFFKEDVSEYQIQTIIEKINGRQVGFFKVVNRYQILLNQTYSQKELEKVCNKLNQNNSVDLAYLNRVTGTSENTDFPNDTKWKGIWNGEHINDENWGVEAIGARKLWEVSKKNKSNSYPYRINVGILDGGFSENNNGEVQHEDLEIKVLSPNRKIDHGTHVAGIIGAGFNNRKGITGILPGNGNLFGVSSFGLDNLSKLSSKPLYQLAINTTASSELGLVYLVAHARCKVVNYSMGDDNVIQYAASRGNKVAIAEYQKRGDALAKLFYLLLENHDFLFVSAAGNENEITDASNNGHKELYIKDDSSEYGYKIDQVSGIRGNIDAAFGSDYQFIGSKYDKNGESKEHLEVKKHIIAVGSAGLDNKGISYVATSSNLGERIDLVAPGVEIMSTVNQIEYDLKSGTSMAAPHVTGGIAALWSLDPTLNSKELKRMVIEEAEKGTRYQDDKRVPKDAASYSYPFLKIDKLSEKIAENFKNKVKEASASDSKLSEALELPKIAMIESNVTMVFDVSGSMSDIVSVEQEKKTKLQQAQKAGKVLVNLAKQVSGVQSQNKTNLNIGIVCFNNSAVSLNAPTDDYNAVSESIDSLESSGGTNIYLALEEGINQANSEYEDQILILLSDGIHESSETEDEIIGLAKVANNLGIRIYTIGFGEDNDDIDEDLLRKIATEADGGYEFADIKSATDIVASFIRAQTDSQSTILSEADGKLRQNQKSQTMSLDVPKQTGDLSTILYSPNEGLEIELKDSEGIKIDEKYEGITVNTKTTPSQIIIEDPKPGVWEMNIYRESAQSNEEPYYAIAAFTAFEREYHVNHIEPLIVHEMAEGRVLTRVQYFYSIMLSIGIFMILLSIVFLFSIGFKNPVNS